MTKKLNLILVVLFASVATSAASADDKGDPVALYKQREQLAEQRQKRDEELKKEADKARASAQEAKQDRHNNQMLYNTAVALRRMLGGGSTIVSNNTSDRLGLPGYVFTSKQGWSCIVFGDDGFEVGIYPKCIEPNGKTHDYSDRFLNVPFPDCSYQCSGLG